MSRSISPAIERQLTRHLLVMTSGRLEQKDVNGNQEEDNPRALAALRQGNNDENNAGHGGAETVDEGAGFPSWSFQFSPVDDHSRLRQRERQQQHDTHTDAQ